METPKPPKNSNIIQKKKATIDIETIRLLSQILKEEDLDEIEYAHHHIRVRLKRKEKPQKENHSHPITSKTIESSDTLENTKTSFSGKTIYSPMVGTAYLTTKPGAEPLIKVGDHIKEGQTLLIIEAMKVMNPLKSSISGKITNIYIKNGSPVEYGESLIQII